MTEQLPDEAIALVLKRLSSKVLDNLKMTKAVFESNYAEGDKRAFRSPLDGKKLGAVYKTDPDGEWVISDEPALVEHLMTFPGNREPGVRIAEDADMAEVYAVLDKHAPHLLEDYEDVSVEAISAALAQSAATGEPAAPGITWRKPGGVVTVRPDREADAAIQSLMNAGLLTWDGQRALPAAGREAS